MCPLSRRAFLISVFLCGAVILGLSSCGGGYPVPVNPPLFTYPSVLLTKLSAEARAKDLGALVFITQGTSMQPLIYQGDYLVVEPPARRPWESLKGGEVITYRPEWDPHGIPVTHRLVTKDAHGWLAAGDGVRPDIDPSTGKDRRTEAIYRITPDRYIGVVEGIYRFREGS